MSNKINKPKIFVILGPTAVGKSSLAYYLAKKYNAAIINADSLQVYRYFDIGTSKPTKTERESVEHYLLDIINPDQEFNAATFKKLAETEINKLFKDNRKIILVGGSFLYVRILLTGIIDNSELNTEIRNRIQAIKDKKGLDYLFRILKRVDNISSTRINQNDYIRIQRALEVYFSTGMKISELQSKHRFNSNNYDICKIGLKMDRPELNKKINSRVDEMIQNGFIDEVKNILEMDFDSEIKPMKSIGYKEINSYLSGAIDKSRAIELIKQNSRRYAKRQTTWLRKENDIFWYSATDDTILIENKFKEYFDC